MKYLLDTDVIIDHIRSKKYLNSDLFKEDTAVSVITLGELLSGAYKSTNIKLSLKKIDNFLDLGIKIIDLNSETIDIYAQYRADLETSGQRLDEFDLLIAATALIEKRVLVTRNLNHFKRIKNLKLA